ncbi:hypothetical protein BpHYR1_001569 [Brachionus plicatilis]|uniref:Uncharacterized protein n=1 Tax=Brachionus plicatilis TaxID=10195 RepID=A0A3M7QAM0_BRAPC|nr:hypothetical protein BpHYR1_001569 [Brachionus plicatilis]
MVKNTKSSLWLNLGSNKKDYDSDSVLKLENTLNTGFFLKIKPKFNFYSNKKIVFTLKNLKIAPVENSTKITL